MTTRYFSDKLGELSRRRGYRLLYEVLAVVFGNCLSIVSIVSFNDKV